MKPTSVFRFRRSWLAGAAYLSPLVLFLAIYVTAAGHGFLKDDFSWIWKGRVRTSADLVGLFTNDTGFYRPVVLLTFTLNEWLFGADPLGYGLTNVLLALGCFGTIVLLGRSFGLPIGAAWLAGSIWLLNFHFIRMGVLWISGRTALIATLFATAAATALVRRSTAWSVLWLAVALFAKEDALFIPLTLLIWLVLLRRAGEKTLRSSTWIICSALIITLYIAARTHAHSWTPWTAPDYYRYEFTVAHLIDNAREFADRSLTLALAVTVVAIVVLGWPRHDPSGRTKLIFRCGLTWLVLGFAPTILLPVRSDLYACLPTVGASLIAGALCANSWTGATAPRRRLALTMAIVLVAALAPIHYARTNRWVRPAEFSSQILGDLERFCRALPEAATVVVDEGGSSGAPKLGDTFGIFLNEAFVLRTGKRLNLWIEPPLMDAAETGLQAPCSTCVSLRLAVKNGRLQPSN